MEKKRWGILLTIFVLVITSALSGCVSGGKETSSSQKGVHSSEKVTVNIGIQQSIGPLLIAKEKKLFEEAFAKVGAQVKWTEFQSGPPYFEAIAADRLDFGQVGNAPVIAGQAANVPFKEIATTSDGKKGSAILLPKNSPIKTLQDLKGKKVAVAKGSSAFHILYSAINQAGLKPSDVKIIQLQPDEAKPAFDSGQLDAWAIWDPYITIEQVQQGATILADGESLKVFAPGFSIVRTKFAEQHPELVTLFLQVYQQALTWQKDHLEDSISIYAKAKKLDKEIVRKVIANASPVNAPITIEIIDAQQKAADLQFNLGAIKKKIDPAKVVDNSFLEKALKVNGN